VASWLLLGLLLPHGPVALINCVAAFCFGVTQVVYGVMLLLNVSGLADRMASDSVGRHVMGRGFFLNHHPLVWRLGGIIALLVGVPLLFVAVGLLVTVTRRGPFG
jgi:hypothetical protein